jgi:hypothetical protein
MEVPCEHPDHNDKNSFTVWGFQLDKNMNLLLPSIIIDQPHPTFLPYIYIKDHIYNLRGIRGSFRKHPVQLFSELIAEALGQNLSCSSLKYSQSSGIKQTLLTLFLRYAACLIVFHRIYSLITSISLFSRWPSTYDYSKYLGRKRKFVSEQT